MTIYEGGENIIFLYGFIILLFILLFISSRKMILWSSSNRNNIEKNNKEGQILFIYQPALKAGLKIYKEFCKRNCNYLEAANGKKTTYSRKIFMVIEKRNKKILGRIRTLTPMWTDVYLLEQYYAQRIGMVLGILFVGIMLCFILECSWFLNKPKNENTTITRPTYEEGIENFEYLAKIAGLFQLEIQLPVSAREYSTDEIQVFSKQFFNELEDIIKGNNVSLDAITGDLIFPESVEGYPFNITWESSNLEYVKNDGSIQPLIPDEKSELVEICCHIQYLDYSADQYFFIQIVPKELNELEYLEWKLQEIVKENEIETRKEGEIQLPLQVEGYDIQWELNNKINTINIVIAAFLISAVCVIVKDREIKKTMKLRECKMLDEYPEIVNKLALYMMAGMSVRNAFKKIAGDYLTSQVNGWHPAYDEMIISCRELDSKIPESQVYSDFGKRSRIQKYNKLAGLLCQNLKIGTRDILQRLDEETSAVFDEKKRNARRLGEEASTKLLLPMMMMLTSVMAMIIVPAFMSF